MITDMAKTAQVILPEPPAIPGLVFRRFRGECDYPIIADITNRCWTFDGIHRAQTTEDVASLYQHPVNFDPRLDTLFAEVHETPVGYIRTWWHYSDAMWVYRHLGFVLPEWRSQGIGRALLRQAECRLREVAVEHPDTGPHVFDGWVADTETAKEALLRSEGYAPVRYFFDMLRDTLDDIPEVPLPQGIEIRPVRPEHHRAIWEANNEAFRDHWGYTELTDDHYRAWLEHPYFDQSLWQVAWDGDQIAGVSINLIPEATNTRFQWKVGYVDALGVRRPWRKRGLGRALLVRSLHAFKERGLEQAALGVDSENLSGALRLYEAVGFRIIKRLSVYRKPMT